MLALSQDRIGIGGGGYASAGHVAAKVSQNVAANYVTKSSAVAAPVKDPEKSNPDVVQVSEGSKNAAAASTETVVKDFPPNYLKQMGEDFPPDLLKKAYEAYKQEFPANVLKQKAENFPEKFPPNYFEELKGKTQLAAPQQAIGVERQAINAYMSNAQA